MSALQGHPIVFGTVLLLIVLPFFAYVLGIFCMMVQDFVQHHRMKRDEKLKWKKWWAEQKLLDKKSEM